MRAGCGQRAEGETARQDAELLRWQDATRDGPRARSRTGRDKARPPLWHDRCRCPRPGASDNGCYDCTPAIVRTSAMEREDQDRATCIVTRCYRMHIHVLLLLIRTAGAQPPREGGSELQRRAARGNGRPRPATRRE